MGYQYGDPADPHRIDNMTTEQQREMARLHQVAMSDPEKREQWIERERISGKIRYLKESNPGIAALMELYKNNDQLAVMEKYIEDAEKFRVMYDEAGDDLKMKNQIWSNYINFQLRIFELVFGSKSNVKVQGVHYNITIIDPTAVEAPGSIIQ